MKLKIPIKCSVSFGKNFRIGSEYWSRSGSGYHSEIKNRKIVSCFKDTHQIWFSFANFLWRSGWGWESEFYFKTQCQKSNLYIKDTYQVCVWSANSFESSCLHRRTYIHKYIHTDRQTASQTLKNVFFLI